MPAKLKVFRTTIGFDDAYVAAPSRAAALRAWGAATDLFAMGAAEQVADPKQMAAALERPGVVVRRPRGSDAEHVAAAGKSTKRAKAATSKLEHKPPPKPSRAELDAAERSLVAAQAAAATALDKLDREVDAIRRRRDEARQVFERNRSRLEAARDKAASDYERAIKHWRAK